MTSSSHNGRYRLERTSPSSQEVLLADGKCKGSEAGERYIFQERTGTSVVREPRTRGRGGRDAGPAEAAFRTNSNGRIMTCTVLGKREAKEKEKTAFN